jgi:hypothetical protein
MYTNKWPRQSGSREFLGIQMAEHNAILIFPFACNPQRDAQATFDFDWHAMTDIDEREFF